MIKFNKILQLEQRHHDNEAVFYAKRRKSDYIWEVPESMFLLKNKYFFKNAVVIDMGCGPAISTKQVIKKDIIRNIKYIGVDISRNMLKIAKKNIPDGKFIHGDIETVRFPNRYADIIISMGALHHSLNKNKTLMNWNKIIKNGGYLLLREPTIESLKRGEGESPMEEGVDYKRLIDFFQENNYKIVSSVFFGSKAFHLFNRIMIKIGLGSWKNVKFLWYPVVFTDVQIIKLLSNYFQFFRGLSFTLIARKQ